MPEHRVASLTDIPPGRGREFRVADRIIAIWNIDGTFHATDARCPHQDAPLCFGAIEGTIITCPMHGWRFDVTTGAGVDPHHHQLRPYPIHIRDDALYIDF